MHLSAVWIAPLAAAAAGAAALTWVAHQIRRDLAELQSALRPLRTGPERRSR